MIKQSHLFLAQEVGLSASESNLNITDAVGTLTLLRGKLKNN